MEKKQLLTEFNAGVTTFFTMAYIVVVNPAILSTPGTGLSFDGVLTATVLLCFLMTLFMGLYAKLPYAVAPGMGINAYFAFSVVLAEQIPWQIALGMVFWSGVIFVLISVTPVREAIAKAIPHNLRIATAAGIGIFLAFIGLKNAGMIAADPATFVKFGKLAPPSIIAMVGLAIMVWLHQKKKPYAFLAGMLLCTLLGYFVGEVSLPQQYFRAPDFSSVFLKADLWGSLQWVLLPTILSLMFTDLFDSISTFIGVSHATGMTDEKGEPKNLRQGLIVDAGATLTAGLMGTSSGTAYIESAAGIEAGGRSGWTAIFTALCFLPCFFISPIAEMIPAFATAPVLILVGAMMFRSIRGISFEKLEDAVPPYLTIILIPLTFSITQGILWGFISHVALYLMTGRKRELSPLLIGLALLSVGLLWIESQ